MAWPEAFVTVGQGGGEAGRERARRVILALASFVRTHRFASSTARFIWATQFGTTRRYRFGSSSAVRT
jgi:hypothetical protein